MNSVVLMGGYRYSQGPPARSTFYHISYFSPCQCLPQPTLLPAPPLETEKLACFPWGWGHFPQFLLVRCKQFVMAGRQPAVLYGHEDSDSGLSSGRSQPFPEDQVQWS